jgi:hypothetical protein
MLPDTGIDDVKKQRNAEYAKHINDPILSSLKMEGIRLLYSECVSVALVIQHAMRIRHIAICGCTVFFHIT